jgi:hypothetical protein
MVKKLWAAVSWHLHFVQGRDSLEDDEHTGRPKAVRTECKIEEVTTSVCANRSLPIDDIAAAVGISHGTCHKILTDELNMLCVSKHCVSRVLTQDQRDDHMIICGDLISSADEDETFLNQIIIGDETWVFSLRSTTEVTNGHLEIVIIATKKKTTTGQVTSKGDA